MNRYKALLLVVLGLSVVACSDLEEEPIGEVVPETFFTDVASVQVALNGVYARAHHRFFLARETSIPIMLRSDMIDIGNQNTRAERIAHNNFTDVATNDNTSVAWKAMYDIIAAANLAIQGAGIATGSEEQLNRLSGEAHFFRAMTYFHLVRQFGSVIYIDEPITDADAISNAIPFTPEELYAEIIEDLEFAKSVLPVPEDEDNKSVPSKVAASAYLASVYLTIGDYANALSEAQEIIDREGEYGLGLEPDFQNLFHYERVKSSNEIQDKDWFIRTFDSFIVE